jgi:CSLREA domain-containing protein
MPTLMRHLRLFSLLALCGALLFPLGQATAIRQPAVAILVDTLDDELNTDGDCSLREAMTAADTNLGVDACPAGSGTQQDGISFSVNGTITLTAALPGVTALGGALSIQGSHAITISGDDNHPVFSVASGGSLGLYNLTVRDGFLSTGGGCLSNLGGAVQLQSTTFEHCQAWEGGGALANRGGLVVIDSSTFTQNTNWGADHGGGALFNGFDGTMQVISTTLSGNTALNSSLPGDGGGIYNISSTLTISGSLLDANIAHGSGGGIYSISSTLTISDSLLETNQADGSAGGIHNINGALTISGSLLKANQAGGDGGGINTFDGTLSLTDTRIISNTALGLGGGLANWGNATIYSSTLSANSAGQGGGMISPSGGVTITLSTISANQAEYGGGVLNKGEMQVISSTILENTVQESGGGFYHSTGTLDITASEVAGNTAHVVSGFGGGGGLYNDSGGTVMISQSLLRDNLALQGGGLVNAGVLSLGNTTLHGNQGGAVMNTGALSLLNCTLADNQATSGGAGIASLGGSAGLRNTILDNPGAAGNCSGAIFDLGYNLDSQDTCGFDPGLGSLVNTNPLLLPLADNGGLTWTMALLPGSPPVDAGGPGACPFTDQRGYPRPIDGNRDGEAICDMGAYEASFVYLYLPLAMR